MLQTSNSAKPNNAPPNNTPENTATPNFTNTPIIATPELYNSQNTLLPIIEPCPQGEEIEVKACKEIPKLHFLVIALAIGPKPQ